MNVIEIMKFSDIQKILKGKNIYINLPIKDLMTL